MVKSIFDNGGYIGKNVEYISPPSFVVGTNYNQSAGTTFAYPAGIQKDDFIIISQSVDTGPFTTAPTDSSSTAYTILLNGTSSDPDYLISYKFADGTESGINVTLQTLLSRGATVIQVFRNIDKSQPFDVTSTTASNSTGDPDAPSITTVTNNCMIVAIGFLDDDTGVTVTVPTGYSNLNYGESDAGDGGDSTTMMASKLLTTAGAENPGVFVTSADDTWRAVTVALRMLRGKSGIWSLSAVLDAESNYP